MDGETEICSILGKQPRIIFFELRHAQHGHVASFLPVHVRHSFRGGNNAHGDSTRCRFDVVHRQLLNLRIADGEHTQPCGDRQHARKLSSKVQLHCSMVSVPTSYHSHAAAAPQSIFPSSYYALSTPA